MKKIYALLVSILIGFSSVFGQSTRLVLLEEFTSSTCGPCAGVNPTILQRMQQYPDVFTAIFYHVGWPSPGNDPMYLANAGESNARVSLYGINAVPWSVIDGNYWIGNAYNWTMTTMNNRQAVNSPFELTIQQQIPATHDSVHLTMLAKCTADVSGPLIAHSVVIEKNIHFSSPPGTNGEKDFPNVMKKFLPTKSGTILPSSMSPGDYVIIETWWKFANVYDYNQVAAIGFIQNTSTKEIQQACNSSTSTFAMPYDDDVQLMDLSQVPVTSCMGTISPIIQVRNNGNHTVTSLDIKYQIDDGPVSTYTWNGSLGTLKKLNLTLPAITFSAGQQPVTLKVYTSEPNGVTDQYTKNDTLTAPVDLVKHTTGTLYLILRTDNHPDETTWDVRDPQGNVIKSGGPYTQNMYVYRDTVYLPGPECYRFTLYDAGGNGICCDDGNGMYQLSDSEGTVIRQGGTFSAMDMVEFRMDPPVGIRNAGRDLVLNVYPNPFSKRTTVSFTLEGPEKVQLTLLNPVGLTVRSIDLGQVASGSHEYSLDAGNLPAGIYFIRLQTGLKVATRKVTVMD